MTRESTRERASTELSESWNQASGALNSFTRGLISAVQVGCYAAIALLNHLHGFFCPDPKENLNQRVADVVEGGGYER